MKEVEVVEKVLAPKEKDENDKFTLTFIGNKGSQKKNKTRYATVRERSNQFIGKLIEPIRSQ
jgi:hypothetical protein